MELIDKIKRLKKPNAPWHKFYQKDNKTIKLDNKTIYEYLEETALNYKKLPAIEYFGKQINYDTFLKQIDNCAKAFKHLQITKKDIITICMPNTPEAVIAFYALNKLGAIANMIHPLSAEKEIKNYLINNHTKMLVVIDICYEKIKNIIDETAVQKVIIVSAKDSMPFPLNIGYELTQGRKINKPKSKDKYIYWKEFIKQGKNEQVTTVRGTIDTPAVILHSGGTTGDPKGIVLSNSNFNALVLQAKIILTRCHAGDSMLTVLPLFHGFGLGVCTHTALCYGVKVILVPQFNSREFDKLIHKTKPTLIFGVPTLFEALTNCHNVKKLDLSNVKYVVCGGDSLSENLNKRVNDYLKEHGCPVKIAQGYGMTESLAAIALAFDDEINKIGSFGIPFPSNYIKVIDPKTGKTLGPNQDGELCINGPTVMLGYLDNEIATNEVLQIHDDGYLWLHTGDIGYMDNDGVFFYKQRLKRMIISSGYNVYPNYIENIIEQHPAVLSCTVIGIPHSYKIEVPKAFIVLKSDYIGLNVKNSIKKFCEKHLSKHSIPYEFEFRKSLPKTLIGKVDFRKLEQEEKEKRKKKS